MACESGCRTILRTCPCSDQQRPGSGVEQVQMRATITRTVPVSADPERQKAQLEALRHHFGKELGLDDEWKLEWEKEAPPHGVVPYEALKAATKRAREQLYFPSGRHDKGYTR